MNSRPTRDDVARMAGTSAAVVSYVVNNGPRPVSEATRARVLAAISRTGYRPNGVATALARGNTAILGLIVPDMANPFLAQLGQALEREFSARGFAMLIGDSGDDRQREVALVEMFLRQQIAGLIWYGVDQPPPVDLIASAGIPVALLNHPVGTPMSTTARRVITVHTDERMLMRVATTHLIEHGRTRIGILGGPAERLNARERARGWAQALAEAGLPEGLRLALPFTRRAGFEAAPRMAQSGCDAVVASNEFQALGLLAGLQAAGVAVPDDVAVVCVNGTSGAPFAVPALSATELSFRKLASDIAQAFEPGSTTKEIVAEANLRVRRSCGCDWDPGQEVEL